MPNETLRKGEGRGPRSVPVSEADGTPTPEPSRAPDARLELIRLEQEVRSLRYRLEVKDEALRALNERLIVAELDVTRRVADARREMALLLGPVWAVATRLSRARHLLLPDDTRRGRWWKRMYGWLVGRPK